MKNNGVVIDARRVCAMDRMAFATTRRPTLFPRSEANHDAVATPMNSAGSSRCSLFDPDRSLPENHGRNREQALILHPTVTITNSGDASGTNILFTDTLDANTTLVAGSIKATPIAAGDNYSISGNTNLDSMFIDATNGR